MRSLWSENTKLPEFPELEGNINTDVLIIGGGLAGLLCARFLGNAGVNYILLEADTICGGVTRNTTAKITLLHGILCSQLMESRGEEDTRLYYEANSRAIEQYAQMCRSLDCDFKRQDAYVFSRDDRQAVEREADTLRAVGVQADAVTDLPLPFPASAVRVKNQAQFHPLHFAAAIAQNLNIREHSRVHKITGNMAYTHKGTVTARKIIVATHFPFINRHGGYFLKQYQGRSYVIALENAPHIDGMYLEADPLGISLRQYGKYLLFGDIGHRTGSPSGGWRSLEEKARNLFPGATVAYHWAAQDCMTLDSVPYIGNYSALTPDMYVATGFNKWGMTSSMIAAQLLTDLITGRENKFERVFSPSRFMLCSQLAVNAAHSFKNLVRLSRPRCSHLGCALKWNPHEHTWDCPCHGSRFDKSGELIIGPAMRGINAPHASEE